ncbi:helicase C-terminal domain-containing protein [Ligilactobacillus equi]|nr:helicase C-terminal domain-containing protein [Ligilactobacillus equi]
MLLKQVIGVRQLVEFILKRGDLGGSSQSATNPLAAQDGVVIHKRLQSKFPANSRNEVSLKYELELGGQTWIIQGRADGITYNDQDEPVKIIEIKTSTADYADLKESTLDLYFGQATLYAYFLMREYDLVQMEIELLYVSTVTEAIEKVTKTLTLAEAEILFEKVTQEFAAWVTLKQELTAAKLSSLKALKFPFSAYRQNQRELAVAVYKAIALKKRLFVEAPTGTGKTMSTLFPALKAMGEAKTQRVFYLTAKQSTRQVAVQALEILQVDIRAVVLNAKEQMIFPEEKDLEDDENPYMLGYYDRLRPALKDILEHESLMDKEVIRQYAQKYTIDPFEFSLDISLFCDLVICDYNYLFDPRVYLQRFFSSQDQGNFFLIDEAHNLVNRAREMYTATVTEKVFENLVDLLKDTTFTGLKKQLNKVISQFTSVKEPMLEYQQEELLLDEKLPSLTKSLQKFIDYMLIWLKKHQGYNHKDEIMETFFQAYTFLKISDFYDATFRTRLALQEGSCQVEVFCLNPSALLDQSLALGGGAVLFSATLSPLPYYQELLGGQENSLAYRLASPFPAENLRVLVASNLKMTYRYRQQNLSRVVKMVGAMQASHPGNYLVFCPSFKLLDEVVQAFNQAYPTIKTLVQTSDMSSQERQEFLAAFKDQPTSSLVAFAVLGGIFAEGIDLKGRKLEGVAILTVGLPRLDLKNDALKDYFDCKGENGFLQAYQLPGLNNVFQAAGRVIRTAEDCGVVLLLDERFAQRRYYQYFPPQWQVQNFSDQQLPAILDDFWETVLQKAH